ncbi:MAG: penicillin-binding protein 2 [Cyanobacteria bacterium CAN_BIN43]|nr:penicillin-binding protein 2 [Cyanobacteria bacterium CAN_BIN43]
MALSFPPSGARRRRTDQRRSPVRRPVHTLNAISKSRLVVVWSVLMFGMALLTVNLLRIQIFEASMLQERAKGQQMISTSAALPRRPIIDRANNVLAIDRPVYTLFVHPIMFKKEKEAIAAALSPIVNKPAVELLQRFGTAETGVRIADMLTENAAGSINRLQLDGIDLIEEQQRLYPQQNLFANVVGYVNQDRQGQAGVELASEKLLRRPKGAMQLNRSGDGSIIPINLPEDFLKKDEQRLKLTVDSQLQRASQSIVKQQLEAYSAKRGAVLVMDVQDGSLLTMASEPSYDANKYYEASPESRKDWILSDLYEPGSTFKPVNVAIALESGAAQPTDTFYDEGAIQVDGWTIQNNDFESQGGRGNLTIADILKYSSNVGMVHLMRKLQAGLYYGWLERLGLDKETGIDLPAESAGQSKGYEQFTKSSIEPATTAFGQGLSLTPLKLLQLHSMIANGGKLIVPHVVQGLYSPDGELQWQPPRPQPRQIFSPHTTREVLKMMEEVVTDGTGEAAQIPGYRIAGKTGTSQKAAANGGYIDGARITSFVGIFPAEKPRYAVLAVFDEPQGENAFGGTVAAPVVKSVIERLILLQQIPPSQPVKEPIEAPAP